MVTHQFWGICPLPPATLPQPCLPAFPTYQQGLWEVVLLGEADSHGGDVQHMEPQCIRADGFCITGPARQENTATFLLTRPKRACLNICLATNLMASPRFLLPDDSSRGIFLMPCWSEGFPLWSEK